jgi:hypothetical protein
LRRGRRIHKSNRPWVTYKNWKNSWLRQKLKKREKSFKPDLSKYQGKAYGVTVSKENRSAYASAVFYEKFQAIR